MRTRTALLTAAALAAGVASSMAQSNVYSENIVGYVTYSLPAGSWIVSNPLDNGTDDLNSILPNVPSKSTASFWTGSGFNGSTKGSSGWSPDLIAYPGTGFYVNSKSANSATYVGQVACPVGSNVVVALPAGSTIVGSTIPYQDSLNGTNINLTSVPAKSTASFWTGSGFNGSTKGATSWSPNININPGDGFFINSKSANNWTQTLY